MSKRTDSELLADIRLSVKRINVFIKGYTYSRFLKDIKTQDAVIRNFEVIGEAVKKLSLTSKKLSPDIPWKEMAGLRDKLIHDYSGVNTDIIWDIAANLLPDLAVKLSVLSKKIKS